MPTYKVLWADRKTGRKSYITVEADDRNEAMDKAQTDDKVVGSIVEVEPPPQPQQAIPTPPPTDPIEALLAQLLVEVRGQRRELAGKVGTGVLIGMLGAWIIGGVLTFIVLETLAA